MVLVAVSVIRIASCEDPFETDYDVCHPVRAGTERYLRTEMARSYHLIRAAVLQERQSVKTT